MDVSLHTFNIMNTIKPQCEIVMICKLLILSCYGYLDRREKFQFLGVRSFLESIRNDGIFIGTANDLSVWV